LPKVIHAKEKLELVHGDLCGPVTSATPGGRCFFLLLDDVSHYMWVVLLDTKVAVADAIKLLRRRSVTTSFGCYALTMAASSLRLTSQL
jgi:hypothetical protein